MAITLCSDQVGGLEGARIFEALLRPRDCGIHRLWIASIELPSNGEREQATSGRRPTFGFSIDPRKQVIRHRNHYLGHTRSIASWYV